MESGSVMSRIPYAKRGMAMIRAELEVKFQVALDECQQFLKTAKNLEAGSLERQIFNRKWLEVKNLFKRIQDTIDD